MSAALQDVVQALDGAPFAVDCGLPVLGG